jgi:hypothetical protein
MSNTQTTELTSPKSPAFIAYHVKDGKERGYFPKIGAAWPHKDGKGFNIQLDIVPLDGKITLRTASEKKD